MKLLRLVVILSLACTCERARRRAEKKL